MKAPAATNHSIFGFSGRVGRLAFFLNYVASGFLTAFLFALVRDLGYGTFTMAGVSALVLFIVSGFVARRLLDIRAQKASILVLGALTIGLYVPIVQFFVAAYLCLRSAKQSARPAPPAPAMTKFAI